MSWKYLKHFEDPNFDPGRPVFFDIETIGFYGKTRLFQVAQDGECFVYDCYYMSVERLKIFFNDYHLVAHNMSYDLSCINMQYWIPKKIDDTLFMARNFFPELESHSLKNLLLYTGIGKKTEEGSSDWDLTLTDEQLEYAADDVLNLEKLYYMMEDILGDNNYKLDIKSLRLALQYQLNGTPIRESSRKKLVREAKKILRQSKKALPEDLNINSPVQMREFFGTENANAETLNDLVIVHKDERAQHVLNAKKYDKQLNFLEKFHHKRIFGIFIPSGAKSGRWTCKGHENFHPASQNMQQLPRDLKPALGVEDEDERWLVDADYPSLELYCMAGFAGGTGDEIMANMLRDGIDLHKYSASNIYDMSMDEVTKDQRQIGKTANFGLGFGGGVAMFQAFVKQMTKKIISEDDSAWIRDKWLNTYPQIKEWHYRTKKLMYGNKQDYLIVNTAMGRPMRANTLNDALNLPIQGSGSECTKLALLYLHKEIPTVRVVNTVHDSITLECANKDEAEEQGKILARCMEKGWEVVNSMMPIQIPMTVDYDVVKHL